MEANNELEARGREVRAKIESDTRPVGSVPGEPGRIVTGFVDCLGEKQTREKIEAQLVTMVQSRLISPDVAQAVMASYLEFPKTITMDVLKAAWWATNAHKEASVAEQLRLKEQVANLERTLADLVRLADAKVHHGRADNKENRDSLLLDIKLRALAAIADPQEGSRLALEAKP